MCCGAVMHGWVLCYRYEDEEGKLWIVQGDAPPAAEEPEADPTEEDIAAAEQDVVAQAAAVRALKEQQGLTNQVLWHKWACVFNLVSVAYVKKVDCCMCQKARGWPMFVWV